MNRLEQHYTIPEICKALKFSDRSVRKWIKAGDFGQDVILVGSDYRVPHSGLVTFLEEKQLTPERLVNLIKNLDNMTT